MRFTEHELTVAVTGAAKSLLASKGFRGRGVSIDSEWEALGAQQRFRMLDAVGSQVLPVLVALPDVEVAPGTRASYSKHQIKEVVAGLVGDGGGRLQRLVAVKTRTALVQTALAHMPPRPDLDALVAPQEP